MKINETWQTRLVVEDRWYIEEALQYMFDVEQMKNAPKSERSRMQESPVTISYITREEFERRYGVWGNQKKAKSMETVMGYESQKGITAEAKKGGRKK